MADTTALTMLSEMPLSVALKTLLANTPMPKAKHSK